MGCIASQEDSNSVRQVHRLYSDRNTGHEFDIVVPGVALSAIALSVTLSPFRW